MFAEVSIKKHPKVSTKILDIVKKNAENHQKIAHKSPNSLKMTQERLSGGGNTFLEIFRIDQAQCSMNVVFCRNIW